MPQQTRTHTCICFVNNDAYEIVYSNDVHQIVRYRGGKDARGELVDYDQLPHDVQQAIYTRLKRDIEHRNNHPNG